METEVRSNTLELPIIKNYDDMKCFSKFSYSLCLLWLTPIHFYESNGFRDLNRNCKR